MHANVVMVIDKLTELIVTDILALQGTIMGQPISLKSGVESKDWSLRTGPTDMVL